MGFLARELVEAAPSGPNIVWDETNCLLCGGRRWSTLLEAPDRQETGWWFAVVQCQDCGLCFTNPRPHESCLDQFYANDYKPHQLADEAARKPPRWRSWTRRFRIKRPGRLLDFGCGGGWFLAQMEAEGWQVTGLDNAEGLVERLRRETGWRVLHGTFPHPQLAPQSFDLITMWQALEHVPDPKGTLREARRLLVPGGKLVVAVPNIDSLPFRMFGECWFGLDLPRHLTHFAPWTLHVMLERAGFFVERIEMVRHSSWLRHSARLASQGPRPKHWHHWLRTKPFSRLATLYSCLTGQADCIMATAVAADVA